MKEFLSKLFPRVTTSRTEMANYIIKVCELTDITKEQIYKWITHVEEAVYYGHYFYGMIFVEKPVPYILLHELIHHISFLIRHVTKVEWYGLDNLIDTFDILIFPRE